VILYFSKKIGQILVAWFFSLYKKDWRGHADARLGWLIIVGSLPIIVLGLLFQAGIDHTFRPPAHCHDVVVFGIILLIAGSAARNARWTTSR
jgi:undecaprenyl-diphosphatase